MLMYPKRHLYPSVLVGVLFDFWWDINKLHALNLPLQEVALADLSWHLELPIWGYEGKQFQITPQQVIDDSTTYNEHYVRAMHADLACPIIVRHDSGRTIIVDGAHRLLKATLEKRETLTVALFTDQYIPQIVHETK